MFSADFTRGFADCVLPLRNIKGGRFQNAGSEISRVGYGNQTLRSGITDHGIGISKFFRDQGLGCTIFVGSGTKLRHALAIKDQKFAYKNGISIEKNIPRYHPENAQT